MADEDVVATKLEQIEQYFGELEAIRRLADAGVVHSETAETLVAAVGFRNVLAHQYGTIDYALVYEMLQDGLDVFDAFSRQVARWYNERY